MEDILAIFYSQVKVHLSGDGLQTPDKLLKKIFSVNCLPRLNTGILWEGWKPSTPMDCASRFITMDPFLEFLIYKIRLSLL